MLAFSFIYCTVYYFVRKLSWLESVEITDNKLILSRRGRVISMEGICGVNLWGERVLEIVTDSEKGLTLRLGAVEIVFPNQIARDEAFAKIQQCVSSVSRASGHNEM